MPSVKNIGKPCAGIGVGRAFAKQKFAKLHARFDEGGQARACSLLYLFLERKAADRNAAMIAAHATGGYSYQQIADYFGVYFTTVGKVVRDGRR